MANIKITKDPTFLETRIQEGCIPQRFAIATNLIMCVDIESENKGFLLFNYEPEKWNQWYPFFSSVNAMYEFVGEKYRDLVNVFEKDILSRDDVKDRFNKAKTAFLECVGFPNGDINVEDSIIEPEMWLKYSKTQNIWTFYYMEFMQITSTSSISIPFEGTEKLAFMPLTQQSIEEVVRTGVFRGINVVDNTLELLKNADIVRKIMERTAEMN